MNSKRTELALNVWIAQHVLKMKEVSSIMEIETENEFYVYEGTQVEPPRIYVARGHLLKSNWSPATDPGTAMQVLAVCAAKAGDAVRIRQRKGTFGVSSSEVRIVQQAATLEMAICLFARELFTNTKGKR